MEPINTPKYGILAGNYREYNQWCTRYKIPLSNALFVASPANLSGRDVMKMEWHLTGSFYQSPGANDIVTALVGRGLTESDMQLDPYTFDPKLAPDADRPD